MKNKTQPRTLRGTGDHIPVLLREVLNYLRIKKGEKYIDATVGFGGHGWEIVQGGGHLLGIDCDTESIDLLRQKWEGKSGKLKKEIGSWRLEKGNFADLGKIAKKHNFTEVAGILLDLGLSSWQIEKSGRGLSFWRDEPLDMRLNRDKGITAADILNHSTRQTLYEIFSKFGEEQHSGRIVQAVLSARPIVTTSQLRRVVERAIRGSRKAKIKRVARIFQALRIATNDELENLSLALPHAWDLLQPEGRLLVISFHSLEDRTVKRFFKECVRNQEGKVLTKRPVRPRREEIERNKRAMPAKMRVLEKLCS